MGDAPERWHLVHDEHDHVVEVVQGRLVRQVSWTRDGVELASRRTTDETVVLKTDGEAQAVRLKFGVLGPARRVTLHSSDTEAQTGLAGTDLEPEAGSRAAERVEWIGRHPHLHTARQTAIAAAGVGVPVLVVWLLTLVPWPDLDLPSIPLPDLPSIPWPDLPAIPWPDLPSIPWPDVDLPDLPGWVDTVRKFAIPILIAFFIARGEVKRRRRAEAERAAGKAEKVGKVEDEPDQPR